MGDTSDSSSPSDSSSSSPDDLEKTDPTFRCRVRIDPPKIIRKSSRFIKSIAELGKGSLFTVESKDKQSNSKSKKSSKAVHSQIVKKSSIKMPYTCKNDYKGECGTDGGCFCYCQNDKEGACEESCVCLILGMGENVIPGSVPSMISGDMGLSSKMSMSKSVSQKGSATDKTGSKTVYSGMKGASAPSHGQMRDPEEEIDLQDLANEMKSAMIDVSQSMRQVGRTARQNNTNLLSEIPYFGDMVLYGREGFPPKFASLSRLLDGL